MEKRKNGIIFFLMEKNTTIVNRNRVMYAANRMQLQIRHFARGVFSAGAGRDHGAAVQPVLPPHCQSGGPLLLHP